MKKFSLLALVLCFSFVAMAQGVIEFETTEHSFGRIYEQDGNVTHEFVFKNAGDDVLLVTNVRTGCGCAGVVWTRTPIEPGESGTITVTFNPRNQSGRPINRRVTVTTNHPETPTSHLMLRGEVARREVEE